MQPTIRLYQIQHQRALQCAADIAKHSQTPSAAKINAQEIRMSLAHLAGVLKPHLVSEDRLLYPALFNNADPAVAETAKRFWEEMGGISKAVVEFLETWRRVGAIEDTSPKFIEESTSIFMALKKRIDAEETELYPLFLSHIGHNDVSF